MIFFTLDIISWILKTDYIMMMEEMNEVHFYIWVETGIWHCSFSRNLVFDRKLSYYTLIHTKIAPVHSDLFWAKKGAIFRSWFFKKKKTLHIYWLSKCYNVWDLKFFDIFCWFLKVLSPTSSSVRFILKMCQKSQNPSS